MDELEDRFGAGVVSSALEDLKGREVGAVIEALPHELKKNEDFWKMAVSTNAAALRYVPDRLKDKAEWESFLLQTIQYQHGEGIRYASLRQKNSKDFAIRAVTAWGKALRWCSDALRADPEVVLAAVRKRPISIADCFVSRRLLMDRFFWRSAIASRPVIVAYAPNWVRGDPELVTLAVIHEPHMIRYAGYPCHGYKDIVRIAVRRNGMALVHAPPSLRGDPAIVQLAIQSDPFAIVYARDHLRCDYTGFVRRAALFRNWAQARLILLGTTKQGEGSSCPFAWLDEELMYLVLHAFAAAHTAPTPWARNLCPGDGVRQAYFVW